jgi:hypothetical protein
LENLASGCFSSLSRRALRPAVYGWFERKPINEEAVSTAFSNSGFSQRPLRLKPIEKPVDVF